MDNDDATNPYRDTNPVIYFSLTGDLSRGGNFTGNLSELEKDQGNANGSSGITGLLLALVLLAAGLYQWLS